MDLGTGDEIGLDILINMLKGVSREHIGIKQLCIGGQNEDWSVPEQYAPQVRPRPLNRSTLCPDGRACLPARPAGCPPASLPARPAACPPACGAAYVREAALQHECI